MREIRIKLRALKETGQALPAHEYQAQVDEIIRDLDEKEDVDTSDIPEAGADFFEKATLVVPRDTENRVPATAQPSPEDVEALNRLADSMGFGRTHDMLRRVITALAAQPPAAPVEECPRPVIPDHSAKACVESGNCGCGHNGSSADTVDLPDRGTITRNLRGLASRMEYRVMVMEERDGKGAGAITGPGIGIGYLLAKDLTDALTEAAAYIEALPLAEPQGAPDTKLVYVKRWRTLVKLPTKYADEIVAALRVPAEQELPPVAEIEALIGDFTAPDWDTKTAFASHRRSWIVMCLRAALGMRANAE